MLKSKKILAITMVLIIMALSSFNVSAFTNEIRYDGDFRYLIRERRIGDLEKFERVFEATLVRYIGTNSDVIVPATLGGFPVTTIGQNAFRDNENIRTVELSYTVRYIYYVVFRFANLEAITVHPDNPYFSSDENGILYNGDKTLLIMAPRAANLGALVLPATVQKIGGGAFSHCVNLTSITIPYGVTEIVGYTFAGCTNLRIVNLPESLVHIGGNAFRDCTSLTSINIPSSVREIEFTAFQGATSLTTVIFNGSTRFEPRAGWHMMPEVLRREWVPGTFENTPNLSVVYAFSNSIARSFANDHENIEHIETNVELPYYQGISVFINGVEIEFDVDPVVEDGRVLVPMRTIFENIGADIEWDADTYSITATKEDTAIEMQIGNNVMTRNDAQISLDVPPRIMDSRTLVPIRAVSEALYAQVHWIPTLQRVVITHL